MSTMTVAKYLNRAYELDKEINSKRRRITMLTDRAERATSTIRAIRMSGTNIHSNLENSVCHYVDLQKELADDINHFEELQKEIAAAIRKVDNSDYRTLLEYRYLSFCKWDEVAERMGYTLRWAMRLHSKALKAIESHVKPC